MSEREVVLVDGMRTPFGRMGGVIPAPDEIVEAIKKQLIGG